MAVPRSPPGIQLAWEQWHIKPTKRSTCDEHCRISPQVDPQRPSHLYLCVFFCLSSTIFKTKINWVIWGSQISSATTWISDECARLIMFEENRGSHSLLPPKTLWVFDFFSVSTHQWKFHRFCSLLFLLLFFLHYTQTPSFSLPNNAWILCKGVSETENFCTNSSPASTSSLFPFTNYFKGKPSSTRRRIGMS